MYLHNSENADCMQACTERQQTLAYLSPPMWGTTGIHRSGRFCTITWFYLDILICLDHQRGICVSYLMRNIATFHYCCSTMLWMCQGVETSIKSQILWWVFNAAHSLVPTIVFSWSCEQGISAWSAVPVVSCMSSGAFFPEALGACSVHTLSPIWNWSTVSFHLVGACWLWDGNIHVLQLHWEAIASLSMLHCGPTAALELWLGDQACRVPLVTLTRWMIICFMWWEGFPLWFRAFFHFDHMIGLCLATCQQKW